MGVARVGACIGKRGGSAGNVWQRESGERKRVQLESVE